jgi:hypothetical protein
MQTGNEHRIRSSRSRALAGVQACSPVQLPDVASTCPWAGFPSSSGDYNKNERFSYSFSDHLNMDIFNAFLLK